jgi:chromatin assembly factor 1 subunit B
VRRLDWSPDGNILVTPSGCYYDLQESNNSRSKFIYTVYGFVKHDMTTPAFMLPGIKSYATCVRFNPYIYEKKAIAEDQVLLDLPYRMVFAVATTDQVLVYATDSIAPLAVVGNVHYAPINDLTWHFSN